MPVAISNLRLTVESLNEALQSCDPAVRLDAIRSLGCLGRKARRAVPALMEALKDQSASVRQLAALALGEISSRAAIRALREVLLDENATVKRCAALALMNIGAEATTAA